MLRSLTYFLDVGHSKQENNKVNGNISIFIPSFPTKVISINNDFFSIKTPKKFQSYTVNANRKRSLHFVMFYSQYDHAKF